MALRRGIEPIIAAVILVAVALILAVLVVGYLMGLFGGLMGGQPQITITNVIARVVKGTAKSNVTFELYVINAGAGSDRVLRASAIYGGDTYKVNFTSTVVKDTTTTTVSSPGLIPANFRGWVVAVADNNLPEKVSPGDQLVLEIHFERSGVLRIPVTVS